MRRKQPAAKYSDSRAEVVDEDQDSPSPSPVTMTDHLRSQLSVERYFEHNIQDIDRSRTVSPFGEAEAEGDSSVEEELVSTGGKVTWEKAASRFVQACHNETSKERQEAQDVEEELESEQGSERASKPNLETVQCEQPGFPASEQIPSWFPKNIKRIYKIDRHGGALKFKASSSFLR
jgi:hypothetical protein